MIAHQHVYGGCGNPTNGLVIESTVSFYEKIGQQRNIRLALTKRRNMDGEDVEPIIKILSELGFSDKLLQRPICCRNHSHIRFNSGRPANALELFLLNHPQKFDLSCWRKVPNLVHENASTMRHFETAFRAWLLRR